MKRYIRDIFTKEYRWVEDEPARRVATKPAKGGGPTVVPDLTPFISPIDGKEITSRSGLREHEKRHGVFQIGTDLKPAGYNAASKRQNQFNDRAFDAAFGKAVQKLGL